MNSGGTMLRCIMTPQSPNIRTSIGQTVLLVF